MMQTTQQPARSPLSDLISSPAVGAEGIEVARGTTIFAQGAPAEHVYFIHHGQVRLYQIGDNGDERLLDILGPGQWFGTCALAQSGPYALQAVAATQAQLSKTPAKRVLETAAQVPQAAQELIRSVGRELQGSRTEAGRLVFQDCNQRLIAAMIRFSDSAAATQQGTDVVLHLTHEQLAQAVGAARETISLALTELRHRNIVRTGRNRLIFNREALRQLSTEGAKGHAPSSN